MQNSMSEPRIPVLLALPGLLADLAQDILERDGSIRVAGRVRADADGELSLERTVADARDVQADVVLLAVRGARLAGFCEALFDKQPRIKIVSIDDDGRAGRTAELVPRVLSLGELWPERLVGAIRDVAAGSWVEEWPA